MEVIWFIVFVEEILIVIGFCVFEEFIEGIYNFYVIGVK